MVGVSSGSWDPVSPLPIADTAHRPCSRFPANVTKYHEHSLMLLERLVTCRRAPTEKDTGFRRVTLTLHTIKVFMILSLVRGVRGRKSRIPSLFPLSLGAAEA